MGAAFGALIVIVGLALILFAGMAPVLMIPVVLLAGGAIFVISLLTSAASDARVASGPGATGVPSTSEASYDPQVRPR
jgi:hypothetical protein